MADGDSPVKDPSEWKTGQDPPTAAEISHAETLGLTDSDIKGLNKAQLSEKITAIRKDRGLES